MKCKNCGHGVKKDAQFCPECGANLKMQHEKKRSSKKIMIVFTSIITVILLSIIIAFFVGKDRFSPEQVVSAFEDAVNNQDANQLVDLLHSSTDSLEITEENTKRLIDYLVDNEDEFEDIKGQLNNQVEFINSTSNQSNGTAYQDDTYATINITKDGKKWLFFDDYKLVVIPGYIQLNLDEENEIVTLYINDEEVEATEEYTNFGPYMPGAYSAKAVFDNTYVTLEEEETLNLFSTDQEALGHTFDMPVAETSVYSIVPDAQLYINGKESDITLDEGKQVIGSFPNDESVTLQIDKEYPWGHVRSEEKVITSDNYVNFDRLIAFNEEEQNKIMEQLNEMISSYHVALTEKDASKLDKRITNNLKSAFTENLTEVEREEPNYSGELIKATYNLSKISNPLYDEKSGLFGITLEAHYVFHEPKGNIGWLFRDTEKDNYTRSRIMTIVYNEDTGEWLLDEYKNKYFIIVESDGKEYDIK
ncbi:zinc ribbon domain-containing protein [Oceanobacillus chungangensis]|uniref:Uncharacterized protein n=1 Tax=Oceanobacillus chungangensis TaxID=1229152 RepID=A0A3D8Q0F5_9BACI|nr:zinc-ribbon domain-containing protein [Oceanobacillus chungangensis]RDW21713.1 hypothetical protein CWR45_02230 [Oceanobacillus chungangensis]